MSAVLDQPAALLSVVPGQEKMRINECGITLADFCLSSQLVKTKKPAPLSADELDKLLTCVGCLSASLRDAGSVNCLHCRIQFLCATCKEDDQRMRLFGVGGLDPICTRCDLLRMKEQENLFLRERYMKVECEKVLAKQLSLFPWVQGVYDTDARVRRVAYKAIKQPAHKDKVLTSKQLEEAYQLATMTASLRASGMSNSDLLDDLQTKGLARVKYSGREHIYWKNFKTTVDLLQHLHECRVHNLPRYDGPDGVQTRVEEFVKLTTVHQCDERIAIVTLMKRQLQDSDDEVVLSIIILVFKQMAQAFKTENV
jgi:hypothetical protein